MHSFNISLNIYSKMHSRILCRWFIVSHHIPKFRYRKFVRRLKPDIPEVGNLQVKISKISTCSCLKTVYIRKLFTRMEEQYDIDYIRFEAACIFNKNSTIKIIFIQNITSCNICNNQIYKSYTNQTYIEVYKLSLYIHINISYITSYWT